MQTLVITFSEIKSFFWSLNYPQILQNISIIIASIVAVGGIQSWKRETRWKRRYELAEEALSSFYECQEALRRIRFPGAAGNEGKSRVRAENENLIHSEHLDMAYVTIERYKKEEELFTRLKVLKFRFMAVFGREHGKLFDVFITTNKEVLNAAAVLGRTIWPKLGKQMPEEQFNKLMEKMEIGENTIWRNPFSEKGDHIDDRIQKLIEDVETVCNGILSKK